MRRPALALPTRLAFCLLLAAGVALPACAGPTQAPQAPAAKAEKPAPPLHEGPLSDFVPSAGLRWMVIGRPRDLAHEKSLRQPFELLLPSERLDAFAKSSGVDLRTTSAALVAGFDYATLYVAQTEHGAEVEARFIDRLVAGPVVKSPHPRVRRITGVVGETPESLVVVDREFVAVSVGSRLPSQVAELYARKKLKSPTALRGSALKSLPIAEIESAPARFYAPGPFSGEWAQGARGLLTLTVAVAVAVRPTENDRLAVTIYLAGDYASVDGDPATRLTEAWADVAKSNLGRLLGLEAPASPPSASGTPELLRLTVELDPIPLARGLHAAVMAEIWDILDLSPPKKAP